LLARADRVFVSIPGWETMLREMAPFWRGTATWSPIPSNLPTEVSLKASQEVRARLPLSGYGKVLGHFGTYGSETAQPLKRALTALLKADSSRIALLVGRGGEGLAKELVHEPTLTGRVAAVLPSGTLVVEAEREIMMNQEHETVILRGLVRPGDLDATNTVLSNSVGDLEIEVKSKGVISESTRAPNPIMKWILRILNF